MPVVQPGPDTRWRCTLCGNLTRFDVTRATRAMEYVHVDLSGTPTVEERELIEDDVQHVTCRWCKAVDQVELVPRPSAAASATPAFGQAAEHAAAPPSPRPERRASGSVGGSA